MTYVSRSGGDQHLTTGGDRAQAVDAGTGSTGPVPEPPTRPPRRGTYVLSTVTAAGQVQVRTWITGATPVHELTLSTPDPGTGTGSPQARDVVVRGLDGTLMAVVVRVGSKEQRVDLGATTTGLYLTYRIEGGIDGATPTVEGRSLARVLAMEVSYDGADGVVRHLVRAEGQVLNVACLAAYQAPRPCGRSTGDGQWTVDLHEGRQQDQLLAQIESSPSGQVTATAGGAAAPSP
jgi:hypothetical protein